MTIYFRFRCKEVAMKPDTMTTVLTTPAPTASSSWKLHTNPNSRSGFRMFRLCMNNTSCQRQLPHHPTTQQYHSPRLASQETTTTSRLPYAGCTTAPNTQRCVSAKEKKSTLRDIITQQARSTFTLAFLILASCWMTVSSWFSVS